MSGAPILEPRMHAWRIDPQEVERHERRRGRRHAFERLDPVRTALVVVDMIPFFVDENPFCRGVIPNIHEMAGGLRSAGGSVAWVVPAVAAVVPDVRREFFGPEVAAAYNAAGGTGPLRGRLSRALEVRDEDLVVEKSAASAFFPGSSPLPSLLESRRIDTVLIAGTVTSVCCESSARDASTLGYRVIMVADANACVSDESHNATLRVIYRSFGDVRSAAEVVGLIERGMG